MKNADKITDLAQQHKEMQERLSRLSANMEFDGWNARLDITKAVPVIRLFKIGSCCEFYVSKGVAIPELDAISIEGIKEPHEALNNWLQQEASSEGLK